MWRQSILIREWLRLSRQREAKNTTTLRRADEFQPATMSLGAPFRKREPKAGSPCVARAGLVNTIEPIEHAIAMFR